MIKYLHLLTQTWICLFTQEKNNQIQSFSHVKAFYYPKSAISEKNTIFPKNGPKIMIEPVGIDFGTK